MISFIRQIKYEIRNIIRSKFLLIISVLLIAAAIVLPILNFIASKRPRDNYYGPYPMPIYETMSYRDGIDRPIYPGKPGMDKDSITIDGVTIKSDNPFFWDISYLIQEKEQLENNKERFTSPEALDLYLALLDTELQFSLNFAKNITNYQDYRASMKWMAQESMYGKFIFENIDVPEDVLLEAVSQRWYMEPEMLKSKYLDLTAEERLEALDALDEELASLMAILENNDFPQYVDLRIKQENKNIDNIHEQIAVQEQEIINNPSQEDMINQMILDLKRQITYSENNISLLQLRLEKNIIPGEDVWQNYALSDMENYRNQLSYTEILTEEKFNQETWLVQQHGSYSKYVVAIQKQIDALNNGIIIAEKSIDADKPDMKYVNGGSRSRTFQFLNYSIFVALFAALLGGWIMASEFQQGTIRLLMIRPKTRTKILMAKFTSALVICLFIYGFSSLLNIVTNGIFFGFSDYAFPNYTVSGEIGFFGYYLPKMLACTIPVIFIFAFAFMLSVVVKNVAVSIAVPIAAYIGSTIVTSILALTRSSSWFAYTPLPYLQLSTFFTQENTLYNPIYGYGNTMTLNITYGILLLLGLSVVCSAISILVFNRRDIVN
ncbi:MAG: ABC transporter permease [Clostridia bacterium]|nr:ABC transporter permease [Clostridia bacterium]